MSRRGLQGVLTAIGAVAAAAGASGVIRGPAEVINGGPVSANVDNEYRFYAAWYHVLGILIMGAARQPESASTIVRAGGAGFLLAATGRALSARSLGPPHPLQRVLMGIEFAIPAVIIPWQHKVASGSHARRP